MKTKIVPHAIATNDWIANLDDATLRSGHVGLSDSRASDFADYMDLQLERLEERFRHLSIPRTVRKSFGR